MVSVRISEADLCQLTKCHCHCGLQSQAARVIPIRAISITTNCAPSSARTIYRNLCRRLIRESWATRSRTSTRTPRDLRRKYASCRELSYGLLAVGKRAKSHGDDSVAWYSRGFWSRQPVPYDIVGKTSECASGHATSKKVTATGRNPAPYRQGCTVSHRQKLRLSCCIGFVRVSWRRKSIAPGLSFSTP